MAKRSIADVGESLLGGLQSRSRDDDKSAKRKLITAFALQLGIGISNSILKNKSDDYYKNQQVMDKQIKHRAAISIAAEAKNTQTKILNYAKGNAEEYFYQNKIAPTIRANAREQLAQSGTNIDDLDDEAMEAWVSKKGRPLAKELVESHNSIIKNSSNLGTSEQANAAIINSNKRPKNLGKFLFGMVSGRSKSDYTDEGLRELEATGYFSSAESITNAQTLINNNLGFKAAISLAKDMENNGNSFRDKGKTISTEEVLPTKENPIPYFKVAREINGVLVHSIEFATKEDEINYNNNLTAPQVKRETFNTVNLGGDNVRRTLTYVVDTNNNIIGTAVSSDIILPLAPFTPEQKRAQEKYVRDQNEWINYTNIRAEVANSASVSGTNKVDEMNTQLEYQLKELKGEDKKVVDDYFKKMSKYNINPNGGGKGDRTEMELEAVTASSIYLQRKYSINEAEAKKLTVSLYIKKIIESKVTEESSLSFLGVGPNIESDIPNEQVGMLMDLPVNGSSLLIRAISIGNNRVAKQISNNQEALTEDILSMESKDIKVIMEQLSKLKDINFNDNIEIFKPFSRLIPEQSYYYEKTKPETTWWKYLKDNTEMFGVN